MEMTKRGGADFRVRTGLGREGVVLLSAQVMHLRRELSDSCEESARRNHTMRNHLSQINCNVTRLAITPTRRSSSQETPSEDTEEPPSKSCCKCDAAPQDRSRPLEGIPVWWARPQGSQGLHPDPDVKSEEHLCDEEASSLGQG